MKLYTIIMLQICVAGKSYLCWHDQIQLVSMQPVQSYCTQALYAHIDWPSIAEPQRPRYAALLERQDLQLNEIPKKLLQPLLRTMLSNLHQYDARAEIHDEIRVVYTARL